MEFKNLKTLLEKQHYKLAGSHSAVKLCHWAKKSIMDEGFCYKQQFYGIQSHRCLQMTPSVAWCTHKCIFCWRMTEYTLGTELKEFDEPGFVVDECIKQQLVLLAGFGGIPERLNKKKFREAQTPNQAAISLVGEPMVYPKMNELLGEFHRRKFTTFLVSNGTFPERIKALTEMPSQFYVSLDAPDEKTYLRTDNPLIKDGWLRINETLDLMKDLNTRTVVRLTLVKGWNMENPAGYARLIEKAEPDFVEVKAFMFVGGSRRRLSIDNMPSHAEVRQFSEKLADLLDYKIKDEKVDSRVVLISKI
ncbi:MAG: 4-demethylwyosine synthase TYW1 [Candidatus Altiarchaeales archaeon]|nr:4-demethylwyosine synthase TYW1 [Candidatus Altiarchaeales archaeon]